MLHWENITLRRMLPYGVCVVVTAILVWLALGDTFLFTVTELTLAFCLLAQSFGLIAGYAGRLAFGNVMFFGIGGYAVAGGEFYHLYPPLVGVLVGLATCGLIAPLLSLLLWRLTNLMFALVTFALAAILLALFSLPNVAGGPLGIIASTPSGSLDLLNLNLSADWQWIVAGAALVLIVATGTDKLSRSRMGLQLSAVRGDRGAAAAAGIDGRTLTSIVWSASACIASLAGAYYFVMSGFLDPTSAFGLTITTLMIVPAVLGGLLSPWGPLVGAIVIPLGFYLNRSVGTSGRGGNDQIVYAIILIFTMRFMPQGLIRYASHLGHEAASSWSLRRLPHLARRDGRGANNSEPQPGSRSPQQQNPSAVGLGAGPVASADRSTAPESAPVSRLLELPPQTGAAVPGFVTSNDVLLDVRELRKSFGGVEALAGVNFSIAPGELVGIIGPNGAGKTTLFRCISGEARADAGSIIFDGQEVLGRKAYVLARLGIRRTFQIPRIFSDLTVQENIAIPLMRSLDKAAALTRAEAIADAVGLGGALRAYPELVSTVDQRRIELGRAVAGDVRLLLLDEVMSGLSEEEAKRMTKVVAALSSQFGVAAVVVEHVIGFLTGIVERVIVVAEGKIIADGHAGLVMNDEAVARAYFGRYAPGHLAGREGTPP